jgi:hypothetical protein
VKFYTFDQNNSGGSFVHDPVAGIGYRVIIEAASCDDAVNKAESIGLYWDGVEDGRDCSCCGDRWHKPWRDDGTDTPEIYGEKYVACEEGDAPCLYWGLPSYLHRADGTFAPIRKAGGP